MEFNQFHFEYPLWLWGILAIPVSWILYRSFFIGQKKSTSLASFIDQELLPHLLILPEKEKYSFWKSLCMWSILWTLLMGALAGPRWNYTDVTTFLPHQDLCILLDVSRSMDAQDIKPSRLIRARQKIEDLLDITEGLRISLIAFAADPHMITPLTEDKETLRHVLPSIGTELVHAQGSRLSPALIMASRMLNATPGKNKTLLLISDGEFEDVGAIALAHQLVQKGIKIYTLGVGTEEGSPIYDGKGHFIKKKGETVISKLNSEKLRELSQSGKGLYFKVDDLDTDIKTFMSHITSKSQPSEEVERKIRQWDEKFYFLVFPMMAILLFWFRRGFIFPLVLFFLFSPNHNVKALNLFDLFKNDDQLGKNFLEEGHYEDALKKFKDPYRQGVVQYKAGLFAEAEKLFRNSQRVEVANDALYNLGNALATQNKLEEAKTAYEQLLEKKPNHAKAKHNLELINKLLEQQKEQEERQKEEETKKNKDQKNQEKNEPQKGHEQQNESHQIPPKDSSKEPRPQSNSNQKDPSSLNDTEANQRPQNQKKDDKKQQDHPANNKEGKKQDLLEPSSNAGKENKPLTKEQQKATNSQKNNQDFLPSQSNTAKTQQDLDADQWLNQIQNDPKSFLKNQFYIESQRNNTQEGLEPW